MIAFGLLGGAVRPVKSRDAVAAQSGRSPFAIWGFA
jgi:hypothetical protein